ncbi:hypothetical protein L6164_000417 [Bauhinia variegata]|uniref:Uncharacterized protein n=1 Tax=Bauhinia variegata TaxID=167791 RepID=A0ACB9QC57_BAUVA|nr:hypothetical protein L6164_000417 [Bauhinia variegata]
MARKLITKITLILCPVLLYSLTFAQQTSIVESKCGDTAIPFPFYMNSSLHCSTDHPCSNFDDWFEIECRDNQTAFITSLALEVKEIDVENSTISVISPIYPLQKGASFAPLNWSPFLYSQTNKVLVYGCSPFPFGSPKISESGMCVTTCKAEGDWGGAIDPCRKYCCQTKVSLFLSENNITILPKKDNSANQPCDFLMIVDPNWLSKSNDNFSLVLEHIKNWSSVPAVLDWGIPSISTSSSDLPNVKECHDYIVNTSSGIGLLRRLCQCPLGVRGNPYTGGGCVGMYKQY